jgi:hypothetical protein
MVTVSSGSLNTSSKVVVGKIFTAPLHMEIPPKHTPNHPKNVSIPLFVLASDWL